MKISYNWLNTFLPEVIEPQQLGKLLTDTGLEVESLETIETVKGGLEGVVVAEVLTCEKHPNADRLKVTTVNTGKEIVQVVCGAPNVAAGQKVLLATVGTTLYPTPDAPLKMKVSKIRDVESHGMLCAEDELGIGTSHDGILVLPQNAIVGTPAAEFLELENDIQIEIGLTPNRADAMGHIGVARDVLAFQATHENKTHKLILPNIDLPQPIVKNEVSVSVEDTEKCPRYMGITIDGVSVAPSPAWLQKRLRAVGLSPINNVVDITNFVMRELGTPLHAFDKDYVGKQLIVRTAKESETITTLDGVERKLDPTDLVIANAEKAMCIAGVFGGIDSGIKDETTSLFLEAAYFQPVSVRKTAKRHGLNTDASFRFERGVDVNLVPYALKRAAQLILEIAGGTVSMSSVDIYPNPIQPVQLNFRPSRCNSVLGYTIEISTIKTILEALDIEIGSSKEDNWELKIPSYRVDVTREIDVIEEILRIYGFNQIPLPEKLNSSLVLFPKPDLERLKINLAETLVGLGFTEVMNNSLTSPQYTNFWKDGVFNATENVEMLNPLSQDLAVMRQSLIFQLLETVAHNQNRQQLNVKCFEFGKTYKKIDNNYKENRRLTLVASGKDKSESWNVQQESVSYFHLKGIVEAISERLGLKSLVQFRPIENGAPFEDGQSIYILKQKVGEIGWINSKTAKQFGVKQTVFCADLDWDQLENSLKLTKTVYKELPKTFEVRRDFSLLLNKEVQFSQLEELARKVDKKLLQNVNLFDVYEGKNLPDGKKSYAVSFTFQDQDNTLKDEQVDGIMSKIQQSYTDNVGAELRM